MNDSHDEEAPFLLTSIGDIHSGPFTFAQRITEIRSLSRIALPIALGYLLQNSIGLASIISLGHVGTKELAASALATMYANVTGFSLGYGMSSALDTLCSQAHTGSTDKHILGKHLQLWIYTKELLIMAGQNPELSAMSATFTRYLIPGLLPYFISECLKKCKRARCSKMTVDLQAQNIMNAPLLILAFLSPVNIFLQYLLVWNPTFTLGFKGAAIATSITYTLNAVAMVLYVKYVQGGGAWGGWSLKEAFNARQLYEFLNLGVPGILMTCSEWWAFEIIALAAGILGDDMLAAQTVVLNTCSLTYMIPMACGIAATNKIGNALGSFKPNQAKLSAQSALLLGFSLAFFNGLFLFSVRHSWGLLWNSDPSLNFIIASILPLAAVFQLSDAVSVIGAGVLRGIGAQKLGAGINLIAYYIVGVPVGLYLTFGPAQLGLFGLWIGLTVALCTSSGIQVSWLIGINWEKKAYQARERIENESQIDIAEESIE